MRHGRTRAKRRREAKEKKVLEFATDSPERSHGAYDAKRDGTHCDPSSALLTIPLSWPFFPFPLFARSSPRCARASRSRGAHPRWLRELRNPGKFSGEWPGEKHDSADIIMVVTRMQSHQSSLLRDRRYSTSDSRVAPREACLDWQRFRGFGERSAMLRCRFFWEKGLLVCDDEGWRVISNLERKD